MYFFTLFDIIMLRYEDCNPAMILKTCNLATLQPSLTSALQNKLRLYNVFPLCGLHFLLIGEGFCLQIMRKGVKPMKAISEELIYMDTVPATETKWLWYPYIPFGKITVIQGDPGEGKTTLILNIAARLTQGIIPQSQERCEPMNVIYQTAEDGLSDTVKPRLLSAGADCSRVIVINESERNISMSDRRLEAAIAHTHAKLVILDPLQAYLGAEVDMHRANEIRPIMAHLAGIAERYGCAIVLIGHMNKAMGMKSTYRGLGSIDITAAARSVLIVARDRENPRIRVIAHTKSSLAPEGKTVAFELAPDSGFHFKGEYDCNIEEILLGVGKKTKTDSTNEFLKDLLRDGSKPQKEIISIVRNMGISERTLNRAKKQLGIRSLKQGNQWFWTMDEKEDCNPACLDKAVNVARFNDHGEKEDCNHACLDKADNVAGLDDNCEPELDERYLEIKRKLGLMRDDGI